MVSSSDYLDYTDGHSFIGRRVKLEERHSSSQVCTGVDEDFVSPNHQKTESCSIFHEYVLSYSRLPSLIIGRPSIACISWTYVITARI